ncbi:putative aspartic peptidase A1 family protein [Tanacetum coccineum]|uniref:Aspartic peptidase A1 family protein n=1 Tax=Tanacetum coccineum TaxID=301880 RepID=A0ABQ5IW91_9ASTR
MLWLRKLILLLLVFISHEYEAIAQYAIPYTSLVVPVYKHTDLADPLYSAQVVTSWEVPEHKKAKLLIDIDAPFSWHDCIVQWNIYPGSCPTNMLCESGVSCDEYQCTEVRSSYSYKNFLCPQVPNNSPGWGFCSCPVNVVNPITGSCDQGLLNYENLFVTTSNGRNPYDGFSVPTPNAACLPSSSFESFPANVSGVMALSTSRYALPEFLFQAENIVKAIAFCLPSTTSAPGVLFYGNGPYYFTSHTNVDIRSFLSYTPLLNHQNSFGYFIGVNAIVIKRRSIEVPINTTTKLSTIQPYTTLRTDIYNSVIGRFSKVTKPIPRAKPVTPFGLCFKSFTNGTGVSLKVPNIDFSLQEGKKWSISTANSIKQVTDDVACLAFVDGGTTSEHAIVIGTFQFEDNFLMFDLENSTFGFSSSLLSKQTSCANFNFTIVPRN